ncbi:MAG: leucyl/phenylalanyl-tRNA--protein transferase [Burkholderiaceae bacterium]
MNAASGPVWVEPTDPLPDPVSLPPAEPGLDELSGLIAVGRDLHADRLLEAYSLGMFPWFTAGQPVLWWSPDPRMVLPLDEVRLHRSLRKVIQRHRRTGDWRVTLDAAFETVMRACAAPRGGEVGTWITSEMIDAYVALHQRGFAHSVEVWLDEPNGSRLIGGLYGVSIGRMFYGESMFARVPDASKTALIALVALLRTLEFSMIDCQQNTRHLASMGARELPRASFLRQMSLLVDAPAPDWHRLKIELPAV